MNLSFKNLSKYVDIFFEQRHDDYDNRSNSIITRYNAKICT